MLMEECAGKDVFGGGGDGEAMGESVRVPQLLCALGP